MKATNILCPVDFSEPSRVALAAAVELARDTGARLHVVHVYHYPSIGMGELGIVGAELVEQGIAAVRAALDEWTRDAVARGADKAEARLVEGVAWDRICAVAAEVGCELIVIATHGRTGLRHALLGSVAERVVRHAPCSVLVVKERA
jgi:nucleotide-binding universal stress UspA family protein